MNTRSPKTVPQAALDLGVPVCTIRKWLQQRRIAFIRVGGHAIRIPNEEITRLLTEGFVPTVETTDKGRVA